MNGLWNIYTRSIRVPFFQQSSCTLSLSALFGNLRPWQEATIETWWSSPFKHANYKDQMRTSASKNLLQADLLLASTHKTINIYCDRIPNYVYSNIILIFDINENEWTYNRQLTNIHNERIKTKYIPSYIFENEGKIFKKLKKLAVFLRSGNGRS